jgi:putative flavoprotein involved in K+ transport
MDLSGRHHVWLSGRDVGEVPFRIEGLPSRLLLSRLVLRVLFHRILTVDNPIGRKARPGFLSKGGPRVRVLARDLAAAGVVSVPRTVGVENGRPLLEDGRALDVANVIWSTGFRTGFSDWIDLPVLEGDTPIEDRGIVAAAPGLYFVGLLFLRSVSSDMVHGVGRDARRIAEAIAAQARDRPAPDRSAAASAAA